MPLPVGRCSDSRYRYCDAVVVLATTALLLVCHTTLIGATTSTSTSTTATAPTPIQTVHVTNQAWNESSCGLLASCGDTLQCACPTIQSGIDRVPSSSSAVCLRVASDLFAASLGLRNANTHNSTTLHVDCHRYSTTKSWLSLASTRVLAICTWISAARRFGFRMYQLYRPINLHMHCATAKY
jgi:hypothetical protein